MDDFRAMLANSQWNIIALATLIIMTRGAMQGASKPYFVNYYLITDHMPAWLAWFMGSASSRLSAFLSMTMLAGVAGALCANCPRPLLLQGFRDEDCRWSAPSR